MANSWGGGCRKLVNRRGFMTMTITSCQQLSRHITSCDSDMMPDPNTLCWKVGKKLPSINCRWMISIQIGKSIVGEQLMG